MIETWKKVVFFGAHTDDEMICAGTLHRLVQQGTEVHIVTFSQAATVSDRRGIEYQGRVVDEWLSSLDLIGVGDYHRMLYDVRPSSDFQPHRQSICQWIFDYVEKLKPDAVFTLSPEDENPAHSIVGVESERVMRGRVSNVIRCQFPWNYGIGRPNLFISLGPSDIAVKRAVIDCYKSQHFRYDYDNMLMSYARADGLSVKVDYAEKFELIRSVV